VATPPRLNAVTSAFDGTLRVGQFFPGFGLTSTIFSLSAAGIFTPVEVRTFAIGSLEFTARAPGAALAAGGYPNSLPAGMNFSCGGVETSFGPYAPPFGFTPGVADIVLEPATGTFLLGINGGGIGPGGEVRRIGATGCAFGIPATVWTFSPEAVLKVVPREAAQGYGCPCPTAGGTFPVIAETASPAIGQPWTVTLTRGAPLSLSALAVGISDVSYFGIPLPLDLAAFGAPGCVLLSSSEYSFNTFADAAGNAALTFSVPNDPTLINLLLYSQWVIIDLALPVPLPIVLSAGLQSII
jgi:hypothetical protein